MNVQPGDKVKVAIIKMGKHPWVVGKYYPDRTPRHGITCFPCKKSTYNPSTKGTLWIAEVVRVLDKCLIVNYRSYIGQWKKTDQEEGH